MGVTVGVQKGVTVASFGVVQLSITFDYFIVAVVLITVQSKVVLGTLVIRVSHFS